MFEQLVIDLIAANVLVDYRHIQHQMHTKQHKSTKFN
jgi:hypothetical protein